jgi:hypothetical protein
VLGELVNDAFYLISSAVFHCMVYHKSKSSDFVFESVSQANVANMNTTNGCAEKKGMTKANKYSCGSVIELCFLAL